MPAYGATIAVQMREFGVRRLVTGLDGAGKSIIEMDALTPHVTFVNESGSFAVADLWRTGGAPASAAAGDVLTKPPVLVPSHGGSVLRIIRFPPEQELQGHSVRPDPDDTSAVQAFAGQDSSIHPLMHKTQTIDYAIVLSGEIWAILEKSEALMRAGDVLIQRATSHSWANRSNAPCIMAFILIDARE